MTCWFCGEEIDDKSVTCKYCGKGVSSTSSIKPTQKLDGKKVEHIGAIITMVAILGILIGAIVMAKPYINQWLQDSGLIQGNRNEQEIETVRADLANLVVQKLSIGDSMEYVERLLGDNYIEKKKDEYRSTIEYSMEKSISGEIGEEIKKNSNMEVTGAVIITIENRNKTVLMITKD